MTMFKGLRMFIRVALAVCIIMVGFAIVHAAGTTTVTTTSDSFSSKDIITMLLALLQTILVGVGVWLIGNDKELFTRMGKVETNQAVQANTCKERTGDCGPEHTHNRASDLNPQVALKEALDQIRQMLHGDKIKVVDDV
jgi:uncharacterized membrane protein YcjF (UPF0283 family)